uniref:Uncharacterized protein n=1 Tax=Leptospirillum ferrodiazotrophum TaxID=412449 RepID=C6HZ80_9BACT|nr:MAG: hypothetical protein UBAL3_94530057 [Leptospirillum ferrodiazotrophum]
MPEGAGTLDLGSYLCEELPPKSLDDAFLLLVALVFVRRCFGVTTRSSLYDPPLDQMKIGQSVVKNDGRPDVASRIPTSVGRQFLSPSSSRLLTSFDVGSRLARDRGGGGRSEKSRGIRRGCGRISLDILWFKQECFVRLSNGEEMRMTEERMPENRKNGGSMSAEGRGEVVFPRVFFWSQPPRAEGRSLKGGSTGSG